MFSEVEKDNFHEGLDFVKVSLIVDNNETSVDTGAAMLE